MFSGKAKHYFHQLKGTANKHYEEEFLTVGDGFPVENKCGGRGIRVVNTMRKWCCRFKKKWQVRRGQMMEREFMPPGELRDKVRHIKHSLGFGVAYSRYSATVHVFDGTLMICLWYGEGRVGWAGVGWGG